MPLLLSAIPRTGHQLPLQITARSSRASSAITLATAKHRLTTDRQWTEFGPISQREELSIES